MYCRIYYVGLFPVKSFIRSRRAAQGITDGLIQSIMASDIFALKEQFSVTGKKTAVSCPGLAVKRGTIDETVCKIKDPLFFPWDRCNWRHWLIYDKMIIKNTISGAAGRGWRNN